MERWGRSRSCGGRTLGREYVSNSTLDKILRAREELVKDLRTISKFGEKLNEISKQLNKRSKSKSIWKRLRSKPVKQTVVELREMEWKLSEIKNRFALMISHTHIHGDTHVTNANELISNVNLIECLTIQITRLLALCDNFDDIGQSSSAQPQFDDPDYQQFESLTINPTTQEEHQQQQFEAPDFPQFQSLNINHNPDQFEYPTQEEHSEQFEAPDFPQFEATHEQFDTPDFEEFFKIDPNQPTFPADMDPADIPVINPYRHRVNDVESMRRKIVEFGRMLPMMLKDHPNEPREPKFMDVRGLCEDALGYVRSNMGLDYEFVDFASQMVSSYSRPYGYGLHFNFFARQKTAPRYYQAELFFVEVAFGNPVRVIHCAPVVNQPYYLGDEGRPPRSFIFHPNHEYCFHCDLAKNRSLEKGFFLAPPVP